MPGLALGADRWTRKLSRGWRTTKGCVQHLEAGPAHSRFVVSMSRAGSSSLVLLSELVATAVWPNTDGCVDREPMVA